MNMPFRHVKKHKLKEIYMKPSMDTSHTTNLKLNTSLN